MSIYWVIIGLNDWWLPVSHHHHLTSAQSFLIGPMNPNSVEFIKSTFNKFLKRKWILKMQSTICQPLCLTLSVLNLSQRSNWQQLTSGLGNSLVLNLWWPQILRPYCAIWQNWFNALQNIIKSIIKHQSILTLNMLSCLKDLKRYIHILNPILNLAWSN